MIIVYKCKMYKKRFLNTKPMLNLAFDSLDQMNAYANRNNLQILDSHKTTLHVALSAYCEYISKEQSQC